MLKKKNMTTMKIVSVLMSYDKDKTKINMSASIKNCRGYIPQVGDKCVIVLVSPRAD